MPKTRSPTNASQISVTLPAYAYDVIEELLPEGLYGKTRAEVARQLVLDQIKVLRAQNVVRVRRPINE